MLSSVTIMVTTVMVDCQQQDHADNIYIYVILYIKIFELKSVCVTIGIDSSGRSCLLFTLSQTGGYMKVRDVMEPISHWLTPEMTLHEAIPVMHNAKRGHGLSVNAIVVLDGEKKLAGIVSTTDILRTILPPDMYLDDSEDNFSWEILRQDRIEKTKKIQVRSIMTEDVRVVRNDMSIMRCADRLLVEQIRRLPVIALDGQVVGVVYLRDVYNKITELLCDTVSIAA